MIRSLVLYIGLFAFAFLSGALFNQEGTEVKALAFAGLFVFWAWYWSSKFGSLTDALRYKWLRDVAHPDRDDTGIAVQESDVSDWGKHYHRHLSGEALDKAIDEAWHIQAEGGH